MRKLFGRKKKDEVLPHREAPRTSGPPSSQAQIRGLVSVSPSYLQLAEFTLPVQARSLFARERDEEISLDRCRRCEGVFIHTFMDWTTKIIVGIPQTSDYRAISYVWGDVIQLPMRCKNCDHTFTIPMESAYKFRRIMMMTAKSGDTVWLDALSIDQTSKDDKDKIIGMMGDIYSRAEMVAVLFPESNGDGFKIVSDLTTAATAINKHKDQFSQPGQDGHPDPALEELTIVCVHFWNLLSKFEETLHDCQYWRRAWCFQEWALAQNVSITWEGGMPMNMEMVKTTILHAATLTAIYSLRNGAYAKIKMGFPQADVVRHFERVRRLFPDEQAFVAPGMVDEDEVSADLAFPSLRFRNALGLRAAMDLSFKQGLKPPPIDEMYDIRSGLPQDPKTRFINRLSMALHAFASSKREARYEADLISCWASMCNIEYPYDPNDRFEVALQKVLWSAREKVPIYSFCVNCEGAGGQVDVHFLEYARLHEQCNSTLPGFKFHGLPIFTGRADTAVHLRLAMQRASPLPKVKVREVVLRRLERAAVMSMIPLSNREEVLAEFSKAITGTADGLMFHDVLQDISRVLQETPPAHLAANSLVIAMIYVEPSKSRGAPWMLVVWAIAPTGISKENCFVAKEKLNDTLIVATEDASGNARFVAFLTLTDQQSGTMLVKVKDEPKKRNETECRAGCLDMTLKTPDRRGITNSALLGTRYLQGSVLLKPGLVFAS